MLMRLMGKSDHPKHVHGTPLESAAAIAFAAGPVWSLLAMDNNLFAEASPEPASGMNRVAGSKTISILYIYTYSYEYI